MEGQNWDFMTANLLNNRGFVRPSISKLLADLSVSHKYSIGYFCKRLSINSFLILSRSLFLFFNSESEFQIYQYIFEANRVAHL